MDNKLRQFGTQAEYLAVKDSLVKGTVSYLNDTEKIITDPFNMFIATYKVDNVSSAIKLLGNDFNISQVAVMLIDGAKVDSPVKSYTFSTSGFHSVTCILKDSANSFANLFNGCTNLTSLDVKLTNPSSYAVTNMFSGLTKGGIMYYDPQYNFSTIINALPSNWLAVGNY
jgi:hypothetical protein